MDLDRSTSWLAILALALLVLPVPALAVAWRVDHAASSITLSAACVDGPCGGAFRTFRAGIAYAHANLDDAKFDIAIDVRSLVTTGPTPGGAATRFTSLDAAQFPHAYLTTTRFLREAGGRVAAESMLKLRGVVAPVMLDVAFTPTGRDTAMLDFSTRFPASRFGIRMDDGAGTAPAGDITLRGHLELRIARQQ